MADATERSKAMPRGRFRSYSEYRDSGVEYLGQVPAHWAVYPLRRRLFRETGSIRIGPFGSALKLEFMVPEGFKVYGQEHVIARDFNRGSKYVDEAKFSELVGCEIQPCDLVVTMMGSSGRCAVVPDGIETGIMDSHLLRIRLPDADLDPEFVALLIDGADYVRDQIQAAGKGAIMHGLNSSIIKGVVMAVPPVAEQIQILDFLDRETAKIDALVARKERLIELLHEKRSALITRAVTRGLDPNVPMKDSGIEWLGEIPARWTTNAIKNLARPGYKTFVDGDWIESPYITSDGIRLIQTGNIWIGKYREQGFRYISEETFQDFRCTEIDPNDILICRLGEPVARACLAPQLGERMITSVDVCILKPRMDVSAKFLVYSMSSRSYLEWVGSLVRGSTRDRVSRSMLGSFSIGLPPRGEQGTIVAFLDRETAAIDVLITKIRQAIHYLTELRTALVSATVTGKIDVRPARDDTTASRGETL